MRGGNAALTLVGGVLVARGIVRWLDRPDRELLYSRRLTSGETLKIRLAEPAD